MAKFTEVNDMQEGRCLVNFELVLAVFPAPSGGCRLVCDRGNRDITDDYDVLVAALAASSVFEPRK